MSFTPLRSLICPMFMRFRLLYVSPTSACQILTGTYIRSHCYIVQTFGRCFHLSTMASADFSQFVVTTANETACETSPVKVRVLFLHVPAAFTRTSGNLLDFSAFCHLIRISEPYMRFLSVRSEVCLQLLSDSVSRRTPLLFGYVLRCCLRALGTFTH